jgi:hypothetical protein
LSAPRPGELLTGGEIIVADKSFAGQFRASEQLASR